MPHQPVLLKEAIELLDPKPGEFFIDGTVGGGGHSSEILRRVSPGGTLLCVDWDKSAMERAREKISAISKFEFLISKVILVCGNYADLPEILKKQKLGRADGLILDLGFSSDQLESGRGFSFGKDESFSMAYGEGQMANGLTAVQIVNKFNEHDLADIFWKYGDERFSRRIAKNIVLERKKKPIKTTFDLVGIIRNSVPRNYERGRIHPATRVFQSLRIYVNDELGNLEKLLQNIDQIIKPKGRTLPNFAKQNSVGRVATISFHSLEDRLVKNYFREMEKSGKAEILTKKPIVASKEEIQLNPRARSAKLRAIQIQ